MTVRATTHIITCQKAGCHTYKRVYNASNVAHVRRQAKRFGWGQRSTHVPGEDRRQMIDLCPVHVAAYDRVVHL